MNPDLFAMAWLVVAIMVVLSACTGLLLLAAQVRQLRRQDAQRLETLSSMQKSMGILTKEILEALKNERQIELQLKQLRMRQSQIEQHEPEARPYSHAIGMVKRGASIEDLIAICGLSRGEAELIITIHGLHQKNRVRLN
jgi:hypothetical protein